MERFTQTCPTRRAMGARRRHAAFALTLLTSLFVASAFAGGCVNQQVNLCDGGPDCGESCVVDSDCETGRCVGGFCDVAALPIDPNDGSAGTVRVVPGTVIDFGAPALGVTKERLVTIENVGRGPFILENISLGPATSFEFAWSANQSLPVLVAAQGRVDLVLMYTQADDVADTGSFIVATNAGQCDASCDDPRAVTLSLTSENTGTAQLSVSPASEDFGTVPAGLSSTERSLFVRNAGAGDIVLSVTDIAMTGDTDQFAVSLPTLPLFLNAGESEEIPVRYTPTVDAPHSMTFSVTANDGAAPQSATFVGNTPVDVGTLVFEPALLAFSIGTVGATERKSALLRNTSATSVTVDGLVLGPQVIVEFAALADGILPAVIAPQQTLRVFVDFTPQASTSNVSSVAATFSGGTEAVTLALRSDAGDVPGGTNLTVTSGPETILDTDCICQASLGVSAANVDLLYRAVPSGQACNKPADPSCGVSGTCPCNAMNAYGTVTWGSARTENVRGSTWIIDERVVHTGAGQDGTFRVRASLADDCLAVPGSLSPAVNFACCELDCNGEFNEAAPQACFDYVQFPSCASFCEAEVAQMSSTDCLERGPVAVRTVVALTGGVSDVERHFCSTLPQTGASAEVVELVRSSGFFQIASVLPAAVEVGPTDACP